MAQILFTETGVKIREAADAPWIEYMNQETVDALVTVAIKESVDRTRSTLAKMAIQDIIAVSEETSDACRRNFCESIERILIASQLCCGTVDCLRKNLADYMAQMKETA